MSHVRDKMKKYHSLFIRPQCNELPYSKAKTKTGENVEPHHTQMKCVSIFAIIIKNCQRFLQPTVVTTDGITIVCLYLIAHEIFFGNSPRGFVSFFFFVMFYLCDCSFSFVCLFVVKRKLTMKVS